MKHLLLIPFATILGLLAAGCSTTSSSSAPTSTASASTSPDARELRAKLDQLQKGMPAEAVRALLGTPDKIVPIQTTEGPTESWIYFTTYTVGTRHVQTGTTTYTRENPLTGAMETLEEPILSVESVRATSETTLILRDGHLVEWRHVVDQSPLVS